MGRPNIPAIPHAAPYPNAADPPQHEAAIPRRHVSHALARSIATTTTTSPVLEERARASPPPVQTQPPAVPQQARPGHTPILYQQPAGPIVQPVFDVVSEHVTRPATRGGAAPPAPLQGLIAVVAPSETQPPLSAPHRKPKPKVLLCTDQWYDEAERNAYLNDLKCFRAACQKNIVGLAEDDVRMNLYGDQVSTDVGSNFSWFFDPDDIVPGDILILLVTGHGNLYSANGKTSVRLNLFTSSGRQIDTSFLNDKISKLPEHCTLEVVMETCHAEGTIPGLRQIRIMGSGPDSVHVNVNDLAVGPAPSSSPSAGPGRSKRAVVAAPPMIPQGTVPSASLPNWSGGLFASAESSNETRLLETKASVILWAAAQMGGKAFSEADIGQKHQCCVLVGAIYRAWNPNHPNITRRAVAKRVQKAMTTQYEERVKLAIPDMVRPGQRHTQGSVVQAPVAPHSLAQVAMLLSTEKDPNRVLDTPIFQALDPGPPFNKSLMGMSAGGKVKEA